ncbi:PAS domain S-box protein [Pseudoroseomonas globiformis]|uniref:PAS domain S-box protein n=1 Tax=Teichococcus globiformis TaxID=2307229 RepID=A0ABV7FZ27_9PROT
MSDAVHPFSREALLPELGKVLAVAMLSPDGRILRANSRFAAIFGCAPMALSGRRHRDVLGAQEMWHDAYEALWSAVRRGESGEITLPAQRQDGTAIWLRALLQPRMGDAGELLEVLEVAEDVTAERHRMAEAQGQIEAIGRFHAVAHFSLDGHLLEANDRFLDIMGYDREEAVGQDHGIFLLPEDQDREASRLFWSELRQGRNQTAECRRMAKDGREVWLHASYNPIQGPDGKLAKIVAYATDITAEKLRQTDFQWQIAAIHKSHAVITFGMDGIILDANRAFLDAVGYELEEIRGRHHRLFVEPSYAHGAEYASFWRSLARGQHQAGQYRRLAHDGTEIWLQATYNPVFDSAGRPVKVVKYATVVTEETLRQAEHQGQIAALHKALCVVSFSLDGTILDANDVFLDATGYRLSELRGRNHSIFMAPGQAQEKVYAEFWAALARGEHKAAEFKRLTRDGREIWLQATYNPILDLNGRPFRVVKYATDVTATKLRNVENEGQITAINKAQGVIAFSMDGMILEANENFLSMVGYEREDLVGRHHRIMMEAGQSETAEYAAFWNTLRAGRFHSGLYKRIGKDGREVWIQASYNPILDLNGQPSKIIKFASDVTSNVALAEAFEDAKRQAQHDAATSLPNRVRLNGFMSAALAHPDARLAVLYLDLDKFKPINDTYGHLVGDRVLGEVADRLRRCLSHDQIAARIGGDEFVIAAPSLADEQVEALCQKLIDVVTAPIAHEGDELRVGVSIGVALSPADGTAPDELLRCADAALYRSKQNGRGTFSFYASTLNDKLLAYRGLVEDMRRGLATGEFYLEYQPRFDTRGRSIRSVEALVRWRHPERGRISPADFIPAAERSGLIMPLGEWVLRTACRSAAGWQDIGVSVNVSPVQFHNSDVVELVKRVIADTGFDARKLELEVTEGVLLEDAEKARNALRGLKALGVKLAMDDFGTGYSSLSSLRTFPFDVIKIDRQFINDMEDRDGGREVVQAILGLGKALGLSVTAEGVETVRQLTMLTADNCVEVQGYLLAHPMPAERISGLLRRDAAVEEFGIAAED